MAKKKEEVQSLPEEQSWDSQAPVAEETTSPESWEQQAAEETGQEDDWSPLTLDIRTHSGEFEPDAVKIMVYGDTGTQKTRFASTFPDVLMVDVDHGMNSVTEQVDSIFIEDDRNGFEQLKSVHAFLKNSDHSYTTVVLDTLNEMQRVAMRFTVEEFTHIRRSYGNLPGMSDYGKMLYEFMELTRSFISLPMRVVLLAQVNSQQFETDILGPQLVGKNTARELARKMDVIGYIYKMEAEGTDGSVPQIAFDAPNYMTKDRSNKLPSTLPHPSFTRMASFWK